MAFIKLPVTEQLHHITYRPSDMLANRFGFSSVQSLAESIPSGEEVIDVGAGLSHLGHDVTTLREDIRWANFDVVYAQPDKDIEVRKRLGRLAASAPENLRYVGGSILNPPDELAKRFVRIFSYWMLPYIIENNPSHGVVAAWNMIQLGQTDGILSTGPMRSYSDNAQSFTIPGSDEEARELAANIIKPWLAKK